MAQQAVINLFDDPEIVKTSQCEVHAFEKNNAKNIDKKYMFLKIIYRKDKPVFLCEMLLLLKLCTNSFIYNAPHRIHQLNQDLTKRESNALLIRHSHCAVCVKTCTHIYAFLSPQSCLQFSVF